MSDRDAIWKKCADLVAFYERYKPNAGMRIEVNLNAADLWKAANPLVDPPEGGPPNSASKKRTVRPGSWISPSLRPATPAFMANARPASWRSGSRGCYRACTPQLCR